MATPVLAQALLVALAIVMGGLGLTLTPADFRRLREHPRAVGLALLLLLVVLPLACVGLIALTGQAPLYAVGLMLLAASPGGITADLFSHLFGGDVALNLSLTALNTSLSIVSLPLIANAAIAHYAGGGMLLSQQFGKLLEVIAVAYEVGVHNSTLPLYLALSVLHQFALALPSALYLVSMYLTALGFGLCVSGRFMSSLRPGPAP